MFTPQTPDELAEVLRRAASHDRTIELHGNSTKSRMAGPVEPADEVVTTTGLRRVLQYEPQDLTISVEAGLPWRELTATLAANRQMVPLDPPFSAGATVGGVVASNSNGPRRRLYGTARDVVIGMQFATLEGKLVQSGGMVVKNVAGLDMAKLMIGSFGTLAAIAVVNFKLIPMPEMERSFVLPFATLDAAIAARNQILQGALQPAAIDLLNPAAAAGIGNPSWLLAVRSAGNQAAVLRYERELSRYPDAVAFDESRHLTLWRYLEDFAPAFFARHPDSAAVRASCTLKEVESVMATLEGPAIARAGSGVVYGYFEACDSAVAWLAAAVQRGSKAVIEYAPEERKLSLELWPSAGGDVEIMRRVKKLFDPKSLLNRGRLYNRI